MWSREHLAWIAGIIEGEGTFGNPGPKRDQFLIQVSMTDEDIIQRLWEWSNLGQITGPHQPIQTKKDGSAKKLVWYWWVSTSAHSYALAVAIWPWLGERRRAQAKDRIITFISKKKLSVQDLFDRNVIEGDCWVWVGGTSHGRPVFSYQKVQEFAYRYSYRRYVDPNFAGRLTQTCGNHLCVKPEHLRPGRRSSR